MKIFFAIVVCVSVFAVGVAVGSNCYRKSLTKEVNMEQVTVKGQKDFHAQISISYNNGGLVSLNLIPNTTTQVPATPSPKN